MMRGPENMGSSGDQSRGSQDGRSKRKKKLRGGKEKQEKKTEKEK